MVGYDQFHGSLLKIDDIFYLTNSSRCASPGIVVTTPRTEFCVDPDEAWIKSFMKNPQA
uniref:Chemokine (C-C motif) ligand 39, duplicate 2 n=1 Tax=Cyprinus carpio TaxID=7962 RepID=A0A8C2IID4_CYPCA